ncbi:MAG: hypothetical protein PHY45_02375 [Rhodocyclaceae bacterium]|nr:hypothetical protein [Rhodocyclaceae bacterium]
MPNPWIILAVVLALAGCLIGGEMFGHKNGVAEQAVADQAQFDTINRALEKQKVDAAEILAKDNADNLALMAERDQLKTNLEKQREDNRKATDDLRRKYAGVGLRFKPEQSGRSGLGGGCTTGAGTDAAGDGTAATVQLPDALAANLRRLAADCDELNDDYRKAYDYARAVK